MPEPPQELLDAARDAAEARIRMDLQGVAKYLTPEAVDSLRASFQGIPPRVQRYEIVTQEPRGADWLIDVRYFARDHSFVITSRWRRLNEGWMVIHAERLAGAGGQPGFFSRLLVTLLRPLFLLRRPRRR